MCRITFDFDKTDKNEKKYIFSSPASGPTWACVELTSKCNFRCTYCLQDKPNNNELSFYEWCETIRELKTLGIEQISIIGGEPTLSPYLLPLIKFCKENGLIVTLCSNGSIINDQLSYDLSSAGLDQIQINIDHLEEDIHNKIRNPSGGAISPLSALQNCKKSGIATIMAAVVTESNFTNVDSMMAMAKLHGFSSFRLWRQIGDCSGTSEQYFNRASLSAYIMSKEMGVRCIKTTSSRLPEPVAAKAKYAGCPAGRMSICISSDGNVFPCSFLRKTFGNIRTKDIRSIVKEIGLAVSSKFGDLCFH